MKGSKCGFDKPEDEFYVTTKLESSVGDSVTIVIVDSDSSETHTNC